MANYIHCPRDLKKINRKFFWKFTKRQTICFGIGLALGFAVYILTYKIIGTTLAVVLLMIAVAPFALCGMYYKNGLHLEDVVRNKIEFMKAENTLTYKCDNFYSRLIRQVECIRIKHLLKNNGEKIPQKKINKKRKIKNDEIKI